MGVKVGLKATAVRRGSYAVRIDDPLGRVMVVTWIGFRSKDGQRPERVCTGRVLADGRPRHVGLAPLDVYRSATAEEVTAARDLHALPPRL